ncbi:MAG: hypothetical protein RLN69_10130, partial [Woeseiaceae bacterium]
MKLFKELGRRNVIRVAIAYAVASWVLLQIVDVVAPILELPDWAPKLIFIILAIGLVPALLFSWAFELTPEGIKKESEVDRSGSISYQTGRKLNDIIVASLALAVVLLLVERQANRTPETAVQSVAESDDGARSVAVLPFVNMSSDAEQEFFSDGITEEILNSLASVKKLNVAGRTSSFAFKGQNDDLRRIGEALGVDHILEGSVRKSGNQVRITAQLVRVDNGFHLWSETYDRELDDVFAIQDEIANEILKQLKNQLLADETVIAVAQRTDPAVYELYLRAKQRMYTRERAQIEMAVSELDEAIRLDPAYAPAFAQRGIATMLLSEQQYGTLPDDEANRRAKRFIDQSLDLDADLAEGWAALGLYNGKSPLGYEESIDNLMKALSINPNLIDASNWLQISLTGVGDYRGALQMLTEIAEKDPLYRPAFSNAITSFNNFGEQDKAEALIERMRAFDPDNPDLLTARAVNYMYSGRRGEGLQAMEERHKFGNMSGLDKVFLSTGLMATMQFERAASEGSPFIQPFALYEAGEVDEAFRRANEQAASGFPETLFYLLNRDGRSEEVVNYLEERWPSVSAFAAENPGDQFGYSMMTEVAYAYSRNGNQARFDEAMMYVDQHTSKLVEQGVDNFVFSGNRAVQFALLDDYDAAFSHLRDAVERGWASGGIPEEVIPAFEEL